MADPVVLRSEFPMRYVVACLFGIGLLLTAMMAGEKTATTGLPKTDATTTSTEAANDPATLEEMTLAKAGEKKITLEATKLSLRKAIALVEKKMGVRVEIDSTAFDEAQIDADQEDVELKAGETTVSEAFRSFLRRFELVATCDGKRWTVTTVQAAEDLQQYGLSLMYDVTDLIPNDPKTGEPDFTALAELLQAETSAANWEADGGDARISAYNIGKGRFLIVRQTLAIHLEVNAWLEKLRRVGKKYLDPDKPDGISHGWKPVGGGSGVGFF